ncbi:MAG: hypothetical protein GXO31_02665 [Epsilonproteobacteria bacterium]|nr:hypothetical protein [Campylobacterota bacterium]
MMDFKVKVEDLPSYEIGFERGEESGFHRGIERGAEQERIALTKSLLNLGVDVEVIKKATGFDDKKIEEIKKEISKNYKK